MKVSALFLLTVDDAADAESQQSRKETLSRQITRIGDPPTANFHLQTRNEPAKHSSATSCRAGI